MSKSHPVFDSIWYNLIFCLLAASAFSMKLSEVFSIGIVEGPTLSLLIWTVILFHFVHKVVSCIRDKKAG